MLYDMPRRTVAEAQPKSPRSADSDTNTKRCALPLWTELQHTVVYLGMVKALGVHAACSV